MRATMSAVGTTPRPGAWPHFLGNSWSSIWIAATPAASYPCTVCRTIEETTEAGVGIGDQGHRHRGGDGAGPLEHVGVADEAGIGQPEMGRGDAVATHVEGVETGLVGDAGRHQVEHPRDDHQVTGPDPLGQTAPATGHVAPHRLTGHRRMVVTVGN